MCDYIGQYVLVKTEKGTLDGRLTSFNKDSGRIILEDAYNISNEIDLMEVVDVQLQDKRDDKDPGDGALTEENMHALFYDAFNVYGPSEDHFCVTIAMALKKFIKDVSTARVRIVVGSDDVFGRIGLCLARILLGRTELLHVELGCTITNLRTHRYANTFINSGGSYTQPTEDSSYSLVVFCSNRHYRFGSAAKTTGQVILLDLPSFVPFETFTAVGLGFTPENYRVCPRSFYLIDASFGSILCDKYKIRKHYKNSLVKIDVVQ